MARAKTEDNTVYIMQIHAQKYYEKYNKNENHIVTPNELINYHKDRSGNYKPDKTIYIGTMPDSLELAFLKKNFKQEFRIDKKPNGKCVNRTDSIIDVVFNKDFYIDDESKKLFACDKAGDYSLECLGQTKKNTRLQMRTEMYINGFDLYINGEKHHYVFYQRGSAKVKNAHCMFIDERLKEKVDEWAFMGLDFTHDTECDMTSLFAYRALTTSSVIGTIKILPKEILIIDDRPLKFKQVASVTRYNPDTKLIFAVTEKTEQEQKLFDGQSLLDTSKFTGEFDKKGCVLLRNKFFKSCAFNTNIQQWFDDHEIDTVFDMFDDPHKAADIKLITTLDSVKALKFAYKKLIGVSPKNKLSAQEQSPMYKHWLDNIKANGNFGVVKYEKPSHIKSDDEFVKNQFSYQMINSMPLTKEDIKELCRDGIKYIESIRDDFDTFKKYLNESSDEHGNSISLAALCNANPDIQYTQIYKNHRKEIIKSLKSKLRRGKLIVTADNCTMVTNPIEMLRCACGEKITDMTPLHKPYEIYTPLYPDGVELSGFRSPHIAASNVCVFTNCRNDLLDRYTNLTNNIVVMTAYKNDVMSRLQGADTDSDFILLVSNPIILRAARECMKIATPLNDIKGKKNYKKYSMEELAKIDNSISNNLIGRICNLGQQYNSYYWDYKYKGAPQTQLDEIYDNVSMLSSLSQIEIDRAKKSFILQVKRQLKNIEDSPIIQKQEIIKSKNRVTESQKHLLDEIEKEYYEGKQSEKEYTERKLKITTKVVEKQVRSQLLKYNSKDKDCYFVSFNAPMDHVIEQTNNIKKADPQDTISLIELLGDKPKGNADRKMALAIELIANEVRSVQKKKFSNQKTEIIEQGYEKWKTYKESVFPEAVEKIRKHKISKATMYLLICRAYGKEEGHLKCKEELNDCKKTLLDLLAAAHPNIFYECFIKK